jgi:hypothetical protein
MKAKVIGIDTSGVSCGQAAAAAYSQYETKDFLDKLGADTGSINGTNGLPFTISMTDTAENCSGKTGTQDMQDAVISALHEMVQTLRQDISVRAVAAVPAPSAAMLPPGGPAAFVKSVVAKGAPANCGPPATEADDLAAYTRFNQCLPGTALSFDVTFQLPASVKQTANDQYFRFDLVTLGDGTTELSRIPVVIKVPAAPPVAVTEPADFIRDYDSQGICSTGTHLVWGGYQYDSSDPKNSDSDYSKIQFYVSTGDTPAQLGVTEALLATAKKPAPNTEVALKDVDSLLAAKGIDRSKRYLRIRAHLVPSSGLPVQVPILKSWSLAVSCPPTE